MNILDLIWNLFKPRERKLLVHMYPDNEATFYIVVRKWKLCSSPSAIKMLKRFTEMGLIIKGSVGKRNRQPYTLTELGIQLVEEKLKRNTARAHGIQKEENKKDQR